MVQVEFLNEEENSAICFYFSLASFWLPHDQMHGNAKLICATNVLNNPMNHLFNGLGWEMVDCMYE